MTSFQGAFWNTSESTAGGQKGNVFILFTVSQGRLQRLSFSSFWDAYSWVDESPQLYRRSATSDWSRLRTVWLSTAWRKIGPKGSKMLSKGCLVHPSFEMRGIFMRYFGDSAESHLDYEGPAVRILQARSWNKQKACYQWLQIEEIKAVTWFWELEKEGQKGTQSGDWGQAGRKDFVKFF